MKYNLKKHPIITAILLGVLITIIASAFSIREGQHYYYAISNLGDSISDVTEYERYFKLLLIEN